MPPREYKTVTVQPFRLRRIVAKTTSSIKDGADFGAAKR
jgi:hypothetical protein